MPSNKNITPLLGGNYYHIYNRGINRGNIFFQQRNYDYFFSLLKQYILDYVEILAYCLLPNHFHLLLKINETINIVTDDNHQEEVISDEVEIGEFVSEQFRRMFISYSQAINRQENRTGSLFTRNFKRKLLDDDDHLKYLFFYIHYNPVKHGVFNNFKEYKFSSYKTYLSEKPTGIARNHGWELFDGIEGFSSFHNYFHEEKDSLNLE
jgi:REP element-mobilizing transposase RayT